jgi:hypothetical protein
MVIAGSFLLNEPNFPRPSHTVLGTELAGSIERGKWRRTGRAIKSTRYAE